MAPQSSATPRSGLTRQLRRTTFLDRLATILLTEGTIPQPNRLFPTQTMVPDAPVHDDRVHSTGAAALAPMGRWIALPKAHFPPKETHN